eukprot:COSAG02_NODE_1192_length_13974_cov_16.770378_4_plen_145_part_00
MYLVCASLKHIRHAAACSRRLRAGCGCGGGGGGGRGARGLNVCNLAAREARAGRRRSWAPATRSAGGSAIRRRQHSTLEDYLLVAVRVHGSVREGTPIRRRVAKRRAGRERVLSTLWAQASPCSTGTVSMPKRGRADRTLYLLL